MTRPIRLRFAALALPAAMLCVLQAPGISAGVPSTPAVARGEHIARLLCASCHVVAVDQEYPPILNRVPPTFAEIANRPGVTAESLQRFITSTHWDVEKLPMSMPNPMLGKEQTQAVSRYILSLRRH